MSTSLSNLEAPDVCEIAVEMRPIVGRLPPESLRSLEVWCSIMIADRVTPREERLFELLLELCLPISVMNHKISEK